MNMLLTWQEIINNELFQSVVTTIIRVVGGLIVLAVVFKIINAVCRKIEKKLNKNPKVDVTVASFVAPLLRKVLKFFVLICYIGFIGIETSSIAAAITSAGLAIGLAMQGSLSNFAGGFIILLMRPFKVGDYIETCGESGTVESIQIFYTTLVTPDNRVIKIPNGQVASSTIEDVSTKETRRVDLTFSIAYENDFNRAKEIIKSCAIKTGLVLPESEIFVNISSHSSSSIDIVSKVWTKSENYWDLYYKMLEDVKSEFDANGIEIPYSKLDVNVVNKK